ncbi:Sperm-associated antigen 6, partial [Entophlyctis luteolus]
IAKHSVDLPELRPWSMGKFSPNALNCLKDIDPYVRKNSATLICEIAKHTPELAQLIVNSGAVVDYAGESRGNARLPGIMTLGYIAAFSETLALAVIWQNGDPPLGQALVMGDCMSATSQTILNLKCCKFHQNRKSTSKRLVPGLWGRSVVTVLTMPKPSRKTQFFQNYSEFSPRRLSRGQSPNAANDEDENTAAESSSASAARSDLKTKTKRALKCILEKTLHLDALEPLLQPGTPFNILKYVVAQFAKILPNDVLSQAAGFRECKKSQPASPLDVETTPPS